MLWHPVDKANSAKITYPWILSIFYSLYFQQSCIFRAVSLDPVYYKMKIVSTVFFSSARNIQRNAFFEILATIISVKYMENRKGSWTTDEFVCVAHNAKKLFTFPPPLPFTDRRIARGLRKFWVHQAQLNIQRAIRKVTNQQNNINTGSIYRYTPSITHEQPTQVCQESRQIIWFYCLVGRTAGLMDKKEVYIIYIIVGVVFCSNFVFLCSPT